MVEFVVLVSNVFPAGDVADDDGEDGAVVEFTELVLCVAEFEFWSEREFIHHTIVTSERQREQNVNEKAERKKMLQKKVDSHKNMHVH